jgi:hypothetical protein
VKKGNMIEKLLWVDGMLISLFNCSVGASREDQIKGNFDAVVLQIILIFPNPY